MELSESKPRTLPLRASFSGELGAVLVDSLFDIQRSEKKTPDAKQAVNKNSSKFCREQGPQGDTARPSILKAPSPQAMSSSPPIVQTRTHNKKKKGRQKILL
ncbi:hypothetical protein CDAR_553881 [Caerostris darwini]|uniref:Uncharacterized protein n=1 Tax=Caerostris darwini TaxID=1538125 RepID=A0AAV4WK37_9ARAC|nr:hypothetical protein CDAR_553881 [Caerostris darwini]